jgi:hypothetical protein
LKVRLCDRNTLHQAIAAFKLSTPSRFLTYCSSSCCSDSGIVIDEIGESLLLLRTDQIILSLFGDINNLSEKPVSISMPTVTRTVAKGIPPRLRSPARPAKGKTKNKRKAIDSNADERDGSEPEPRSKKRGNKRRREVSSDNDVEMVSDTDPEPIVEHIDMTKITAVPLQITAK